MSGAHKLELATAIDERLRENDAAYTTLLLTAAELHAKVRTQEARIAELEKALEWQPIETSPTTPMYEVIIAGQYDNGVWYVEEGFRNPLGHWNGRKVNPPSYWMPKPPSPRETSTTLSASQDKGDGS